MEHSSFAIDLLANMSEADRVIALEAAEDYLWHEPGDIAVLAGFWKAQAFLFERRLEQFSGMLKEFDESQKKAKEFDKARDMLREAKDVINEKLVAYGANLIKEKSQRKNSLSEAGVKGAIAKNKDTNDIKAWALEKAKQMHGTDKANAKALFKVIPDQWKDASDDAETLIYRALLAASKAVKLIPLASQP